MSELIVGHGCILYPYEIVALLTDNDKLTSKQLADVFVRAEGIETYEIGTKVHIERLGMFEAKIEEHFDGEFVDVAELRSWAER